MPSVLQTPAAGALPAPVQAQTDAQLRPAGTAGRRGPTRRTLLISTVAVAAAAARRLHLYVNGTQQGTATDTRPVTKPGSLMIGRASLGGRPVDFFSGGIKNVQVFDQALSAERVAALAQGGVQ
nr:LamG domain-containing protein [Streptomyces sp. 769]